MAGAFNFGTTRRHYGPLDTAVLDDERQVKVDFRELFALVGPIPAGQRSASIFFFVQSRTAICDPVLDVVNLEGPAPALVPIILM